MSNPTRSTSPLRRSLPAIGGLLACAACCAAPLLLPALLGAGITTGLGAWLLSRGELFGLLALSVGVAVTVWRWRARAQATACRIDGSCGCGPAHPTIEPS